MHSGSRDMHRGVGQTHLSAGAQAVGAPTCSARTGCTLPAAPGGITTSTWQHRRSSVRRCRQRCARGGYRGTGVLASHQH